jgi:N6-L-threonylcarbamoyladenine synthase
MRILGIETSCDDTSVALLEQTKDHFAILAEKTASQIDVHKKYGGVVPEIAAREHAEAVIPVIEAVFQESKKTGNQEIKPDCIAVTAGPGLITSLLVGTEAAKALSYLWDVPLVAVNHIEGHIHSAEIDHEEIQFPALCLVVSGGHTELIFMRAHGEYERIGATLDDAAGECFDKVAKLLGYEYPGGPKISKMAVDGDPDAIRFPRPMIREDHCHFSFAGLKTSALYWVRDHAVFPANDFCASVEQAIVDVLVAKTLRAAAMYHPASVLLVGGVAANTKLRTTLDEQIKTYFPASVFRIPHLRYCMDNGAMIAAAGFYHAQKKEYTPWKHLTADPNWVLGQPQHAPFL